MKFVTGQMDEESAFAIANWTYDAPYDMYNMGGTQESVCELLNGAYRKVLDGESHLTGFYCVGASARVPSGEKAGAYQGNGFIDLGVGMKPELTGRGFGHEFLSKVLCELQVSEPNKSLRLTVATWNVRAIRLYAQFGFVAQTQFEQNGVTFQTMLRHWEVRL